MIISLSYNPRNILAQKTLEYIMSLGVFTQTSTSRSDKASKEIKKAKRRITSYDCEERAASFSALCSNQDSSNFSEEDILSECKSARADVFNRHFSMQ